MIKDAVVFVLGAGASVPFGFPTGAELVRKILAVRKSDVPGRLKGMMCDAVCAKMGFDMNLMKDLQLSLHHSQVSSIDEFLAQPSHKRFVEIGRFLIAAHLQPEENTAKLFESGEGPNKNWYQLVWSHLREFGSIERLLHDSRVTFVTFNYDRSLEHYLYTVLRHHMEADSPSIEQFLRRSIFHVHGTIGSYRGIGEGSSRRYSSDSNIDSISKAMSGIKIIHEVEEFPQQSSINERLEIADRIIFLGFQYHTDNVKKLFRRLKKRPMNIFGSSYGLSEIECSAARKRLAKELDIDVSEVKIGGTPGLGCYDYLSQHVEFD